MTPDLGQRFIFDGHPVRGQVACLKDTLRDVFGEHPYPARVAEQLGEALVAAALLGDTLKFEGSLILQIKGDGPLNTLMVERDDKGRLRGIARHDDNDPALTRSTGLKSLYGKAYLAISLFPKDGERYQGIVAVEGETLAEVIDGYFDQSEQLPTRLWLTADGHQAAGMLLQQLPPNADEELTEGYWDHLVALTETIKADELKTLDAPEILHRLYHEETIRLFDGHPLSFHCSCSRERSARALISLGKEDVTALMQEQDVVSVDCQFCGKVYDYDQTDLSWLTSDAPAPGSDQLQ
ncbi:MAG: Hsp33 family molecular chaperone HslO [Litorivicinus sp.]